MKISLRLDVNGMYGDWGAIVEIPELFRQTFAPMKTCDELLVAMATGDMIAESSECRIVMETRKDAAEILAKELARMIVGEMKKGDTHNGYNLDT